MTHLDIQGTPYAYDDSQEIEFRKLADRVGTLRKQGRLSPDVLHRIRKHFRIKSIYHSNAIEGNLLAVGETRQVVELGLTITGKPLKDQAEARNLSHALDLLEQLASVNDQPITQKDLRQLHAFVLKGIDEDAGSYRSVPVSISGSTYEPTAPESVPSEMTQFSDWLMGASTPEPTREFASFHGLVAAAAAHTWFVTIHPFIDGNGRVARLLMNLMLMRYGFPIAIITKEDRLRYYDALELSQTSDLTPFMALVAECIEESLEEYEFAAQEQLEQAEWAQSLAEKFTQPERLRAENEYEVWKSAMELLKSYMQQTVDLLSEAAATMGDVYLKDFGSLEFEKYAALRHGESAKRTWFLRVDFRRGETSARYLFFFGHTSQSLKGRCDVTLHVAREEPSGSFHYERTEYLQAENLPGLIEVGYEMKKERFVVRLRNGRSRVSGVEKLSKRFFDDVIERHFRT